MFGSQTRFLVVFVLSACVSVTLAATYIYSGNFVESRKDHPNATTTGTFYYLYVEGDYSQCRFRVNYNLKAGTKNVQNLYRYYYDKTQKKSVLYSMCDVCSAESIYEEPDKWWLDTSIYTDSGKKETVSFTSTQLKWYNRKNFNEKTSQVKAILMNGVTSPGSTIVGAIEFGDGRFFRLTSFRVVPSTEMTATHANFKPNTGISCPTPTCSMFTDIVFVLDYSGSVSSQEWNQTSQFVIGVLNSFTFGDNAAAAACLQFNAPDWVYTDSGEMLWVTCNSTHIGKRFHTDYRYPPEYCTEDRTASVLAGADSSSGKTVSTIKADLVNSMSTPRTPYGNTCQGFGLELAMKVFDRSPRKNKKPAPQRIVIAVTDGVDHCPNRTTIAAEKLRTEYGALFIGIGVGLECEYDENFIRNLSSKLGNNPIYFSVKDYGQIKGLVDQLFTPLCDEYSSGCGPSCKGFCGCGKCLCPTCNVSSDKCETISCTTRDGTSNGCVMTRKNCNEAQSTKCIPRYCEKSNGTCIVGDVCAEERVKYPYPCQSVSCKDGTCSKTFDHDTCRLKYKKKCQEWRCLDVARGTPDDSDGCVMVKDAATECNAMKKKCLDVTCNTETFSCDVVDKCQSQDNQCHKFKCEGDGNNAQCVDHLVERPKNCKDDHCTIYSCYNDKGWMKNTTASWDAKKCRENHVGDKSCKIFSCNPSSGCVVTNDTQCDKACQTHEENCWRNVSETRDKCQFTKCIGTSEGGSSSVFCNYTTTDCTKSDAALQAQTQNNDPNDGGCYTYYCTYGTCEFAEVLPRHKSTKCVNWSCVGDINSGWSWVMTYTDDHDNCHNDSCYLRTCDDEQGCIPVKDICESKSTKCTKFTCNSNASCTQENLLRTLDCLREECNEDGTIKQIWKEVSEACPDMHNCSTASCPRSEDDPNFGRCVYTNISHGDDPCTNYTCNSTNNTWIESPKCDDGYACTEDKCSVDGECWTVDIDCYLEINMTGYPCFRAACKEDRSQAKGYRCVRKIKNGAYMDICGRCIREGDTTSSERDKGTDTEAETSCTDAPDEPILKEGIAAASVAMIILGAVIIGGAIATSGVLGTKTLLERARAANNQSAHTNPLFEDNAAEMMNPSYAGED